MELGFACAGLACGPNQANNSTGSGDNSGGTTDGAQSTDGAEGAVTDTSDATATLDDGASTGSATATGGSDDGPLACTDFPPMVSDPVSFEVLNMRGTPIYLRQETCAAHITLTGPDDATPTPESQPICDLPSCQQLAAGDCLLACPGVCLEIAIRIDPGASYVRPWNGTIWEPSVAPAECTPDECSSDCSQEILAASGTYVISAAYSECPNADPGDCECPAGESTCAIQVDQQQPGFPQAQLGSGVFEYPADAQAQIIVK